ncbi:MAG: GAF domain-containing protein [Solirubrobacteraceae bacterium]
MSSPLTNKHLHRLLDAGRVLVSQFELDDVLNQLLDTARELTGAQYAALGVLDDERRGLERFIAAGIDEATQRAIGDLPRGRGILGVMIGDPRPLRLADLGSHPQSYGFPAGHPPMRSFLGVPILIRGLPWGNLYLTEKAGGDFDETDEETVVIVAEWAAIAIENARLHQAALTRRHELERAIRGLEATQAVAVAVGAETDLGRVLELTVKRGRALVDARSMIIMLREGDEFVVAAAAGHVTAATGLRVPIDGSMSGQVLSSQRAERIADVPSRLRIASEQLGVTDARTALLVPLVYRGQALGILAAFDRSSGATFTEEHEHFLRGFAASAATAVATARTVQEDRMRHSLAAADSERRRWARELHDETLQALGGLRVLLAGALRRGDAAQTPEVLSQAVEQIEHEIANLRAIITELRPAALDELGLRPAIESLIARQQAIQGIDVTCELDIPDPVSSDERLAPELETAVYRLVQESLANAIKHSAAGHVDVTLTLADDAISVAITDDGHGFDPEEPSDGFGVTGMRERVLLAGGTLSIDSSPTGTRVLADLPLTYAADQDEPGLRSA